MSRYTDEKARMRQFPKGPVGLFYRRCNLAKSSLYANMQPWPPAQQHRNTLELTGPQRVETTHTNITFGQGGKDSMILVHLFHNCLLSNHYHTKGHEVNKSHNTCVPLGTHH